jgi:hypothetical protein
MIIRQAVYLQCFFVTSKTLAKSCANIQAWESRDAVRAAAGLVCSDVANIYEEGTMSEEVASAEIVVMMGDNQLKRMTRNLDTVEETVQVIFVRINALGFGDVWQKFRKRCFPLAVGDIDHAM